MLCLCVLVAEQQSSLAHKVFGCSQKVCCIVCNQLSKIIKYTDESVAHTCIARARKDRARLYKYLQRVCRRRHRRCSSLYSNYVAEYMYSTHKEKHKSNACPPPGQANTIRIDAFKKVAFSCLHTLLASSVVSNPHFTQTLVLKLHATRCWNTYNVCRQSGGYRR